MDGTFAGDGPGPRCMILHVKNVMLASADQVAIDAVAARLVGFDTFSIKFMRLAPEAGPGNGRLEDIEIYPISGCDPAPDVRGIGGWALRKSLGILRSGLQEAPELRGGSSDGAAGRASIH